MRLGFYNNEFVIQQAAHLAPPGPSWKLVSHSTVKTYATKNIKAAAKFRSHADNTALRIFNKLMLKDIALPTGGGPLCPNGLELFDFQLERGIPHILKSNRTYLAHQPGLGKSAQSICAINAKPGPAQFIVPSFLRINWAREITKWAMTDFPDIAIVPVTDKQANMNWNADYIIVPDSMIQKAWVRTGLLARKFRYTFIDEGHRFKTPDAGRTVALFGGKCGKVHSPGLIYKSEHVCMLSGTPLLNRPIELWPMLYAMAPEIIDFMPYNSFGFKYGGAVQDERGRWTFPGSCNEDDLNKRIMGRFMQRIKKTDVLKDLPPKIREVVVIDRDTRAPDIKALDQELIKHFRRTKKKLDELESLGDYAVVRHATGLAKVEWAADFINNILSSDIEEQLIIFAHHRDVIFNAQKLLSGWAPMVINGGVADHLRTKMQDAFQRGKRRLIMGNLDAMSLGLTLTRATRVIFLEYSWTPSVNEQAEDRPHRIGLLNSILCQYLLLPNSIDEVMFNSLMVKDERIEKVMR